MIPPDYTKLIDAETWAFIDRINSFYPPYAINLPIALNREIYARMSRAFHAGRPSGISVETAVLPAPARPIPARTYRRNDSGVLATLLYFHGGGFVLGDLDSHDDICAELCAGTGCTVVSIDYRLAPEHTGTAAFDDCRTAFDSIAQRSLRPIILIGESAGGTLAASVAHDLRGRERQPAAQVLIYPSLGGSRTHGSYVAHANAPLLTAADLDFYASVRTPGIDPPDHPRYAPLADHDFSGLPPTFLFTAECDPLASDGETYRDAIKAHGGLAQLIQANGLPHGYLRGRHIIGRAGESFARIVETVGEIAQASLAGRSVDLDRSV